MKRSHAYLKNFSHWWRSTFSYGEYDAVPFPRVLNSSFQAKATFFIGVVGCCGKGFLTLGHNMKIYNRDQFLEYVHNRRKGTPLITVCNHTSMVDEPVLVSQLCDLRSLFNARKMRWCLGAQELLFQNRFMSYAMAHGKVIPIVRGEGVYQAGMNYALERLEKGDWIQIFPEGKITLHPIRLKWGVGRLLTDCEKEPIVLPFCHVGMDDVFPTVKPYYPRLLKKVTVLFGEPIRYRDVLENCRNEGLSELTTRKALTDLIEDKLYKLKVEAEKLHSLRFTNT